MALWVLIKIIVLLVNAVAVLNEERFLRRIGFGYRPEVVAEESLKARTINLLHAVRTLLRIPLIFINAFVIVLLVLFG
ncbi:hypothetical protein C9374_005442 [Naegleria lovaniensis]|uniref:Yos1-like protein n=1 Tax=Naegleria lovaniensis TaxID=51637 RepID=A0AA88GL61_NAELO|nr:uncharacterized protein C9374_005442 [Naegleria lovaniensis]KAG2382240.1 hypothetical protein C9374_005442 [Naegleria lovaniensis]